jgi:hypothetical protein
MLKEKQNEGIVLIRRRVGKMGQINDCGMGK